MVLEAPGQRSTQERARDMPALQNALPLPAVSEASPREETGTLTPVPPHLNLQGWGVRAPVHVPTSLSK
jgi:hypothetical protein